MASPQNGTASTASDGAHAPSSVARNPSQGFTTSEGTFHVSKPFRSSSTHKLRAMITFTPRKSHFDISNDSSSANEFRGFFTLFWITMFIFAVRTYIRSFETTGYALNLGFATMFSRDAITLALSDAVMISSTFLSVPFVKAVHNGYIRYYWTGVIIQHVWQCLVLFLAITWTFDRQWPWVQSGFLTLHSIVMIMKVHSYVATNGQLQFAHEQAEDVFCQLHRATAAEGGWDAAVAAARANQPKEPVEIRNGTPPPVSGTTTAYIDPDAAIALRRRLVGRTDSSNGDVPGPPSSASSASSSAESRATSASSASTQDDAARSTQIKTTGVRLASPPPAPVHPSPSQVLAHHPVPAVADLARAHAELEAELTSIGPARVRFPGNITFKSFAVYLLIPTLVYELEYPRTERISPLYVFEKTVATFGTFALLYTVVESFILPITPTPEQSALRALLDLSLPFMIAYLLLFYLIFECICNGFAELAYFADRRFYDDWVWNSTSWDEFARKWNRPVHTFLLRHVYASTMSSFSLSRGHAMLFTFLLSAVLHELVMVIVTKKIRLYLFVLQLSQLPLIAIGRIPAIKRNKLMGNLVFWLGLYIGLPLLCVAYVAY